jgi:hypothetical protein
LDACTIAIFLFCFRPGFGLVWFWFALVLVWFETSPEYYSLDAACRTSVIDTVYLLESLHTFD